MDMGERVTLLKSSPKYVGLGCITLAALGHHYEGDDDINFMAVQDGVNALTQPERDAWRTAWIEMLRNPTYRKQAIKRALDLVAKRALSTESDHG